jgi:hypothetical protein
VILALALGGCADAVPPSGGSPSAEATLAPEPSVGLQAADLQYTCGLFPFRADLALAGPGQAEQVDSPMAAALRAHLASRGPDIDVLPDLGWRLTGMNDRSAEFVAFSGEGNVSVVTVSNDGGGWKVGSWGECRARVALAAGLGAADWIFDPAQPRPKDTTRTFDALVTEASCNDGLPADGRIVGPMFFKSADTVLVIFAVRPRPGGHDCPANPSTRVTVDLREPLGFRELLDGGQLPPGDPGPRLP